MHFGIDRFSISAAEYISAGRRARKEAKVVCWKENLH
jgi:hypothetical protein